MLTFFIGSYTQYLTPDFGGTGHGIYTVQMNTETGVLNILHARQMVNPSYLAMSDDNQFLYANTEVAAADNPELKSYRIKEDFSLEYVSKQAIAGGYPCHIAVSNDNVLVACYETGNLLQFPLDENKNLLECANSYHHSGSGINKNRQEAPHAHQVSVHPNGRDIYVCDLGIDIIKAYRFHDAELVVNELKDITLSPGGGVRHMVFDKEGVMAYAINELTGMVSVIEDKGDQFEQVGEYNSLPMNFTGQPSGSAIRLHPNETLLYVANRQLEAITIFNIKQSEIEVLDCQYTQGGELREINITPDGKWLIACHQNTHDTVVYQIQHSGRLLEMFRTKEIQSPVCIIFSK